MRQGSNSRTELFAKAKTSDHNNDTILQFVRTGFLLLSEDSSARSDLVGQLSLKEDLMKNVGAILLALFLPTATAQAALVSIDSPLGPQSAVLDTHTGMEWLKLSTTANTTTNQVFAEMAPSGRFEQYRYATVDELHCGLLEPNLGIACNLDRFTDEFNRLQAFLDLFGTGYRRGAWFAADPPGGDPEQRYAFTSVFYDYPSGQVSAFDSQQIRLSEQTLNIPIAHWLVREMQEVPEPSTLALLGLGVLALTRRHAARKSDK